MAPRKRGRDEMESSEPPPHDTSLLNKLRNMWEFACFMQYIFTFGKVVKIDEDFDIEDLETECLQSAPSDKLEEIGLSLLKWISSHRSLTLDNWDEYTRRQYIAKAPQLNPYGTEENPRSFRSFDIFQKIRILHQLTVWTFWNPDRIRERMPEQKETDQTTWRVEELGWDRADRSYYVLDDSRLYRRTEPTIPVAPKAKPKSNTLRTQAARRRASKRRRIEASQTPDMKGEGGSIIFDTENAEDVVDDIQQKVDTLGGYTWECVAVTSQQYQDFLKTIEESQDPNEKELHLRILEQVLPVVERAEESHRRKIEKKQKELMNAQKLSGAKRSSRLADKHERERQDREAIEEAEKRAAELAAAHREQERQAKMELDRQSRMMTREQRTRDREYKRLLHEEELAKMAEDAKRVEAGEARGSERHLRAQIQRHKRDLEGLSAAEEWVFDCSGCGVYGKNVDDGAHSVACEKCNVWQHSQCLGIRQIEAEQEDFHFICKDCKQKLEDAKRPNIKLKFRAGLSSSPPQVREKQSSEQLSPGMIFQAVEIPVEQPRNTSPPHQGQPSNGPVHHVANGVLSSPYMQHPASRPLNGPSAVRTNRSPDSRPASDVAQPSGSHNPCPKHPYPSNPPQHLSTAPPTYTNGHTFDSSHALSQLDQDNPPAPDYSNKQHSHDEVHQSREVSTVSTQQLSPVNGTPRKHPVTVQIAKGARLTSNTEQGHLPSPILSRPSMSPTQGNPDVGPVAGGLPRSPVGMPLSLSSEPNLDQGQNKPIKSESMNMWQRTHHINGEFNGQDQSPSLDHHHHQHRHLSGLSPTKNSPHPPPLAPTTSYAVSSSPSSHLASAIRGRSVSGTPVFPPTEMLQPSPKQLSKSPVPTPSKAPTPARVGEDELKRVSDELRERIEGRRSAVDTGRDD